MSTSSSSPDSSSYDADSDLHLDKVALDSVIVADFKVVHGAYCQENILKCLHAN